MLRLATGVSSFDETESVNETALKFSAAEAITLSALAVWEGTGATNFLRNFFADFFTFFGERRSGNARVLPLETSLFFFDCASTTWMTPLLSIVEPTESRTLFDEVFLTRGAGDFALVPTSSRVDLKFYFRREFVHSLKVPSPLPETCSDWRFYTRSGRQCPSTVSQLHFVLAPELHLV